jgi:hypothetical protein
VSSRPEARSGPAQLKPRGELAITGKLADEKASSRSRSSSRSSQPASTHQAVDLGQDLARLLPTNHESRRGYERAEKKKSTVAAGEGCLSCSNMSERASGDESVHAENAKAR